MRKIIAKYVQIPFFHKKSKIHRFLINFFFFLTKFWNLALMRNLGLEASLQLQPDMRLDIPPDIWPDVRPDIRTALQYA